MKIEVYKLYICIMYIIIMYIHRQICFIVPVSSVSVLPLDVMTPFSPGLVVILCSLT